MRSIHWGTAREKLEKRLMLLHYAISHQNILSSLLSEKKWKDTKKRFEKNINLYRMIPCIGESLS